MLPRIPHFAALACHFLLTGCAYRFTNSHIVRPEGIRTVAVEAVYDTSREVLPHEMLWQALQDAVAADGHLELAPQARADALLRAHVHDALVGPYGDVVRRGPDRDPDITQLGDAPPRPSDFRPLTQAGRYRELAQLNMVVDVELWSLRTRTLLMRRSYPLKKILRAVQESAVTPSPNNFLRYDEGVEASFNAASQSLARTVVRDLLVK